MVEVFTLLPLCFFKFFYNYHSLMNGVFTREGRFFFSVIVIGLSVYGKALIGAETELLCVLHHPRD